MKIFIVKMRLRCPVTKTLPLTSLVILSLVARPGLSLRSRHPDQLQRVATVLGDPGTRHKRDAGDAGEAAQLQPAPRILDTDRAESSVFHLNNSHLHLMVHWAGKGSSIVFCLARDQVNSKQ